MPTHWKQLTNPDYIGAYDFQPGEERIVTIKDVKRQMVTGPDGKKEECTIVFFDKGKPMILNVTNAKSITKLSDTPYIEQWVGVSIKLIVVKVKAFGEVVDALRIKSEKVVKPMLQVGTPNFEACRKAYLAEPARLDSIKAKYEVSSETEAELKK